MARKKKKKKDEQLEDDLLDFMKFDEDDGLRQFVGDIEQVGRVSTGLIEVDRMLDGGLPKGRIVEVSSREGLGKSSLLYQFLAEAQRRFEENPENGIAALIDQEFKYDPYYGFHAYGLKHGKRGETGFMVLQPPHEEAALNCMYKLIKSTKISMIGLDSVPALVPKAELEGEVGNRLMMDQARLLSQALRMINQQVCDNGTTVIFINQVRITGKNRWTGAPIYESPGAMALKFWSCMRLRGLSGGRIMSGDDIIGHKMKLKLIKNQAGGKVHTWCEVPFYDGEGICKYSGILFDAIEKEIIEKRGSHFYYGESRVAQGFANLRQLMKDRDDIWKEIREAAFATPDEPPEEVHVEKVPESQEDDFGF